MNMDALNKAHQTRPDLCHVDHDVRGMQRHNDTR